MGGYTRSAGDIREDTARVFDLFPRLRERSTAGRHPSAASSRCSPSAARSWPARLLLLDEPSLGLAPILVEQIFGIIHDINAQGTTVLLVEQNALMALNVAHRTLLPDPPHHPRRHGGRADRDPQVRQAYLGRV